MVSECDECDSVLKKNRTKQNILCKSKICHQMSASAVTAPDTPRRTKTRYRLQTVCSSRIVKTKIMILSFHFAGGVCNSSSPLAGLDSSVVKRTERYKGGRGAAGQSDVSTVALLEILNILNNEAGRRIHRLHRQSTATRPKSEASTNLQCQVGGKILFITIL